MKKLIVLMMLFPLVSISISQPVTARKELLNYAVKAEHNVPLDDPGDRVNQLPAPAPPRDLAPNETTIGTTWFDLQSNASLSGRISFHPDGTISAVWTYGVQASSFPDRGTGYNYYNGSSWGPQPNSRIENTRCGWPSYDTWGTAGEINVAHNSVTGLEISTRATRGSGSWTQSLFQGPTGIEDSPTWPRLVTSGTDHDYIHLVYNSYDPYQGQEQAMIYSRSTDGGATWNPQNIILPGTGSSYYNEIGADEYSMAANGSNVAILCADAFYDLFVLKSTDNGDNWSKTVIWEHPYPFFDWDNTITDTFFCVDNSASVAIEASGKVHVAFGISRALHDAPGTTYYFWPYIDGIGYWNEDMATFSNNINALAPPGLGYPTEMATDVTYVGWSQDVSGNGSLDFTEVLAYRELGLSTMPNICVDNGNRVFLVYSSTTETYDNGIYNYKKIWARGREAGSWGSFVHLTDDIVHIFDECVYPVLSATTDNDYIHMVYQADYEPGNAIDGDHAFIENYIIHSEIPKTDLVSATTYYLVTTLEDPSAGGTTAGEGYYTYSELATISATSSQYWDFESWTEADTLVTYDTAYTFEVYDNRTFTAHFIQTYGMVSTMADPPEGGSTGGDGVFPIDDSVTVTASTNPNWIFDYWMDSDTIASYDSIYKFKLTGDRALTAHFHDLLWDVTTTADPIQGGSTMGDGTYPNGDTATVTALPVSGWTFVNWTEDGNVVSTDSMYTFEVLEDRDLVGHFNEIGTFSVTTYAYPPEGGQTVGDGSYEPGEEVTVSATSNPGWNFDSWREDGNIITTDTAYTFIIEEDRVLVAHFFQDTCVITTFSNPPEAGTTSGDGSYLAGDTVTVLATATTDWTFMNWTEGSTVVSVNPSYTFMATYSCELTANFEFGTGVKENPESNLLIYPIPSNGIIHVTGSEQLLKSIDQVIVFDIHGKLILNRIHNGGDLLQIDLSGLKSGIYLLKFSTENTSVIVKRIIKN